MTDNVASRSIRVRSYRDNIHDVSHTFRLSPGVNVRAALRRAALAAMPKAEDWAMRVFTVERTAAGERVAAVLDQLAQREMGDHAFAAALAATLDGTKAVLVASARDSARIERLSVTLSGPGR
ncbi:MAG: hypothetical protein JSS43_18030 [Proteobacteria bacterium]|nr:hypothetical protein [Pseudomonadota bacterium]